MTAKMRLVVPVATTEGGERRPVADVGSSLSRRGYCYSDLTYLGETDRAYYIDGARSIPSPDGMKFDVWEAAVTDRVDATAAQLKRRSA